MAERTQTLRGARVTNDKPTTTYPKGRVCDDCGIPLSIYNPTTKCSLCDQPKPKTNHPRIRTQKARQVRSTEVIPKTVTCARCGVEYSGEPGQGVREIRRQLRERGWVVQVGGRLDFCPDCKKPGERSYTYPGRYIGDTDPEPRHAWLCPHHDRWEKAGGKCGECYNRVWRERKQPNPVCPRCGGITRKRPKLRTFGCNRFHRGDKTCGVWWRRPSDGLLLFFGTACDAQGKLNDVVSNDYGEIVEVVTP